MAVCASPVKLLGQTLFLGASISSFSTNMGWGGSRSSLTVDLIEDDQPLACYPPGSSFPIAQYPTTLSYADDHYYTCGAPLNDSCYVNERGEVYNSTAIPAHATKNVPGKLYYAWTDSGLISRYWVFEDPGFFGAATRVAPDGSLSNSRIHKYNIIGTPVIFKLDDFIFAGIVDSWDRENRYGSVSYTVQISSLETILSQSYIILNSYPGSIFSKISGKPYGGPKNYVGPGVEYTGKIAEGVIPNVFNVYGFLESMAINNFGGAKRSEEGIPSTYALDALAVLTGCSNASLLRVNNKTAFSPFGRIVSRTMETVNSVPITPNFKNYAFGVISPTVDTTQIVSSSAGGVDIPRCTFALDLSSIKRPPIGHRILGNNGIMTLSSFIDQIVDATAQDRYTKTLSFAMNNSINHTIKINTIDRSMETHSSTIENTISSLERAGFLVTTSSFGKERNENSKPRMMRIGGPQQRLLQAKNYRLSYNQTNYIYHASIDRFVDLNRFGGSAGGGKIRIPSYFSTRNRALSIRFLGADIESLFNDDENLRQIIYGNALDSLDVDWRDNETAKSPENVRMGNYPKTFKIPSNEKSCKDTAIPSLLSNSCVATPRYNPLYYDTISPYFGLHGDNIAEISKESNITRFIRPVYQDSWDGQLAVGFYVNELPLLNLGFSTLGNYGPSSVPVGPLPGAAGAGGPLKGVQAPVKGGVGIVGVAPAGPVGPAPAAAAAATTAAPLNKIDSIAAQYTPNNKARGFLIKETEFRCAMESNDSYIAYCFGKSKHTKPDLFNMLVSHYTSRGLFFGAIPPGALVTNSLPGGGLKGQAQALSPSVASNTSPSTTAASSTVTKTDRTNFDIYLNHNFIKDLTTIAEFVKSIGTLYYGKKYMVKMIEVSSYRERTYAEINITVGNSVLPIFNGNGTTNNNYQIDAFAWEEPGNYLDDSIVVGDENYYVLCNDKGQLPPIIGYNSTDNIDYLKQQTCIRQLGELTAESDKQKKLMALLKKEAEAELFEALKCQAERADPGFDPNNDPCKLSEEEVKNIIAGKSDKRTAIKKLNKLLKQLNKSIGGYLGCDPSLTRSLDPATKKSKSYNVIRSSQFLTQSLNLVKTGPKNDYVMVGVNGRTDAFKNIISRGSSKLYGVSSTALDFEYLNPNILTEPRAIIDGFGIQLENSSYMYSHDPNLTIISNIALEDLIYYDHMSVLSGAVPTPKERAELEFLATYTSIPFGKGVKIDTGRIAYQGAPANSSYRFGTLQAKMAHPFFAAVPIKSNQYCYGPWTNYPSVRSDLIYPNAFNSKTAMENMIGDIDIEVDEELVPWNYGGMTFLDAKVIAEMDQKINPQYVLEKGSLAISGPPIFELGGRFEPWLGATSSLPPNTMRYGNDLAVITSNDVSYIDAKIENNSYVSTNLIYPVIAIYNPNNYIATAPIIQSISMSLGSTGSANTNYSLGTYDRKRGSYAKQYADNIRSRTEDVIRSNKSRAKNRTEINNNFLISNQKILQQMQDMKDGAIKAAGSKLYGSSPVETLIGRATPFAPFPFGPNKCLDIGAGGENASPAGLYKAGRTRTWVGLYPGDEVGAELINGYESKSAMSLDGLLSPISFYPTQYGGTYSISSHIKEVPIGSVVCPRCNGDGKIVTTFVDYVNIDEGVKDEQIEYPCPACSRSKLVVKNAKIINSMKGKTKEQQIAMALKDTKPEINIYAYNPIVVPYGEFRNPNAQTVAGAFGLDKCRHSISVVGRGEMPIGGELTFGISNNIYADKLVDMQGEITSAGGVSSDYYEHDIFNQVGGGGKSFQNQRFFGLRGPLMLHSWGYDTDGYPVPNHNNEPKAEDMDQYGRFRRFILTSEGLNDYEKQGVFIHEEEGQQLGDVVGRNYKWDPAAVKYKKIKAKPSKYFHLNWAEHPELWPVGPIDLRWDDSRKLWAAGGGGCTEELLPPCIIANSTDISTLNEFLASKESNTCPYKMVNITLEEDLIKEDDSDETYAARGFIDDIEYSKEPLTRGYRRLVYVVDRTGYSAPRGTKLLCKYSIDSGFYEPISKPVTMAKGKIVDSTNAKIEQHYVQGRRAGIVPSFVVPFDNPMEFQTTSGKNGMFVYINGKWTLTSIKNSV